ncbi:outer dynein arm-docking complex subunit 4-like [Cardiocondyla obscurior]|uniref:outer dynein arm-docking complex subunit 4-like n=1 Tax=Cardiocondyla obscurior TaxID=286306 RepID=UPI0039657FA2
MSALKREEPPKIFREAIVYREWGYRLASLGRYLLAVNYFEKAYESADAEDLRTLIGLYRALIKCTKYIEAEKLSEKCMKIDPGHYKVRHMRMEALFQIGEFGHSLVHAYEGARRHGVTFEHGVYQANETIEDCIGRNTSPIALLLLYSWIRHLWRHELVIGKPEEEESELEGLTKDEVIFTVNDPEVQRQERMKRLRVVTKMDMGSLTIDKDFLEKIVSRAETAASSDKRLADHIKDTFDAYSDKTFPLKQRCLSALYKLISKVYLDARNLTCLDDEETKTRRFAMASAPLELAWLHHEFCKFLVDIRRFDLARFYAKKGQDMAQMANCEQWILNIDHLMLRMEIYQNNRSEARDIAISALAHARKLNIDYLIDFYERAVRVVDELDVERSGDFDGVAARQQLILDLMPKEMKGEVDFLWRRMDFVPAVRRLSVMPGCKPIDRKFKMPSTRRTILPSPPKDPERDARLALLKQNALTHERPGFVNFQDYQ